jgi:hypothetical protein
VFSWIFFRAASISQAAQIVRTVFSAWWVGPWDFRVQGFGHAQLAVGLLCLAVLLVVEGLGGDDFRAMLVRRPRWQRWSFYYGFVLLIVNFGMFHSPQQFIYFQF